jgi:divalent metal cation (Fe/Co/Zn/Cd) transporter
MHVADIARVALTNRSETETGEFAGRGRAVRATLLAILVANAAVVAVKLTIGIRTGTLAVLGAALESGLDMLNNVMGILLVTLASQAPDDDHPYGHDKFETLGAIGIVGFLSITCFELLREGVQKLVHAEMPRQPTHSEIGVLAATVLVNIFVVWYERKRGRELQSAFLMAIIVALIIAWTGYGILRETIPILVDQRGVDPDDLRQRVAAVDGVRVVRSVRSRLTASGTLFAEVTIGVNDSMSVVDAHRLADAVESRIAAAYGVAEVTVHVEPA